MWCTADEVARHLGTVSSTDDRLAEVVAASDAWCKRQRPDLIDVAEPPADVKLAAILYAAYLFRLRTSPQGLPSDGQFGTYDVADTMSGIYRLLGNRKPVAR